MGLHDDEEPRILFEFIVKEYEPPQQHLEEPEMQQEESPYKDQVEEEQVFEQPHPEYQDPPVAAVPEQRKKLDTKKQSSKTYMNPIGNPKKRDGGHPEPPAP